MREEVAEGQGFEPWRNLRPCRFSRPVHSTTLPTFRCAELYLISTGAFLARRTATTAVFQVLVGGNFWSLDYAIFYLWN